MVKRKKLHRRCAGLFAATFILVFLAPVFLIRADAMPVEPHLDDDGLTHLEPTVYRWTLPLDILTSNVTGITVENPLMFVGVENATNQPFNLETPFLGESDNFIGDPLGRWHFEVTKIKNQTNFAHAYYAIQIDSSPNWNCFSFSNSDSFVASTADIFNFLHNCVYVVQPGYTVTATVTVDYRYPVLIHESGWELEAASNIQTFSRTNSFSNAQDERIFEFYDFEQYPDDVGKTLIVDNFNIKFDVYNPYDDFCDVGSLNGYSASMQAFSFEVKDPAKLDTFFDFYNRYPSHRVFVSNVPGSSIFDLTEGLKTAVGGFMGTEIVPGLSFGGLLAVAIGLSLVVVYFKLFK